MIILLSLFAYPSIAGPSGSFELLSAKNLPMANMSFFLNMQYTRERYPDRYYNGISYGVYHHYATSNVGISYGIIDYIEMYLGGSFYGKYDEQMDNTAAGYRADSWVLGNRYAYGGLKFMIPIINDTTKLPLVWLVGLNGGGNLTFSRPQNDAMLSDSAHNFMPYVTHSPDFWTDFMTDIVIFPLSFHLNVGYNKPGKVQITFPSDTLGNFFNSALAMDGNYLTYGGGFELQAGPYTSFTLGLRGCYFPSNTNAPDSLFTLFGIRFITPVGVTFDFGGDYMFKNTDFVPDWNVVSGSPENYYSSSGKWRFNFGFTTTSALVKRLKPKRIKKGVIAITVTDLKTDLPIQANVVFTDTSIAPIQTDTEGKATVQLKPGVYTLKLIKDGYVTKKITLTVQPGQEITIEQALRRIYKPKGIFTGTVTDARSKKPIGAKITFLGTKIAPITSDLETGIFKADLAPGTYNIKIEADGYVPITEVVIVKDKETTIKNFSLYEKLVEKKKIVLHNIHFRSGKAILTPDSYPILDQIVELLKANPNVKIEIGGHTDSVGSSSYNLRLSEARANSVRGYLIQHGIPAERLMARGYGETRPIAPNTTREGRAQNRRVEFTVLSQ